MIVFLDVQNSIVLVYTDSGVQKVPFNSLKSLEKILGNNKVLYVTNAVQTNAKAIISSLTKARLSKATKVEAAKVSASKEKNQVIANTGSVTINNLIPITGPGKSALPPVSISFSTFESFSVETLEARFGKGILQKNSDFRIAFERGFLTLVDVATRERIFDERQAKIDAQDQGIDKMLVNTSVDKFNPNDMFSDNNIEEIDLEDRDTRR
jgi:hypothetical protein